MTTIEERVVQMKFDGAQFLAGIDKSLQALAKMNQSLKMQEGTKGLQNIGAVANKQAGALTTVADNVQHISDKFKAMGVVAVSAINNVTNQAIFAGQNLVKSLTIDPVLKGFQEYELNMNSIQTILSNTKAAGTNLNDVTKALDELNHYSDQTIYNFAEMAKNIGTFTAAGVDLGTATQSIKGIANLAAMSGTNSERAAGAMYQLSQAISAGRVTLEDWNSVVNAGMGGAVFQRALAQTAVAMGKIDDSALKLTGSMKNVSINGKSFRESIMAKPGQESWLTGDVLTATLKQFTGDLKDAELAAMGFTAEQIKGIQAQAQSAKAAATEVKTLSQLFGTLKESAGSGWSQTWRTIFGDFEEAKTLFTDVNNVIGGWVSASADARNKVLADWKELGGRQALIEGIGNAFKALVAVVKPVKDAFREIFPKTTGQDLANFSKQFAAFTKNLMPSAQTVDNLKRSFKGFFALLDIGWMIVKEFVGTIFDLLGIATEGSGGILEFTAKIGDWLVKVRDAIKNGEGLSKVFEAIGTVLAIPIKLVKGLIGFIGDLIGKTEGMDILGNLSPMEKVGKFASAAWEKVLSVLDSVGSKMQGLREWATEFFGQLGTDISNMFSGIDWQDVFAGINTGLFAGIVLMLRNLIGGGGAGGIMENISDGFEAITGSLQAMQNTLRAATLVQIAAAVLMLSIAMDKLAKINQDDLIRAGAAITYLFTNLMGAMLIFEKFSSFTGFAKMPFVAVSMILLATAVNILATAVEKLSGLDWEELAKGLTGTIVLLGSLVAVSQLMGNPGKMISTGLGLLILAAGIRVLVGAVTDLSGLSWEELAKGLTGVGALLVSLALFTKFAQANNAGIAQGLGILLLAAGIKVLASAVKDFAGMDWDEIGRGLTAMGGGLVIVAGALKLLPSSSLLSAAAIFVVAASLKMIADALEDFGNMQWDAIGRGLTVMAGALVLIAGALKLLPPQSLLSAAAIFVVAASLQMIGTALNNFSDMSWEEIAKGLVMLSGSLGIIAGAMMLMTGALPGAAALLVVAASLAILSPILQAFGDMSWEEILKGLTMLAGALAILGVAGLLLTPVIPSLIGLGAAITLLGAGLALAGAGVFLFATGLTLLAAAGGLATAALVAMVAGLLGLLPLAAQQIGAAIIVFAGVIEKGAPAIGRAILAVLNTIIDVIVQITPKVIDAIMNLITKLLDKLADSVPKMVDAAGRMITGILNGIAKNVGKMAAAATKVVTEFLNALGDNIPKIADAGAKMVIKLVNGIAEAIRSNSKAMGEAGANLGRAIIEGMVNGLRSGVGTIISAAKSVASSALSAAMDVLGINSPSKEFEKIGKYVIQGFRKGLDGNKQSIDEAFNDLKTMLKSFNKEAEKDILSLQKKLADQRKKGADKKEIAKTKKALAQAKKEEKASEQAYKTLTKNLADEKSALGKLAASYDVVTAKLEKARQTLADAVKTRDDYNKQIREQYGDQASATGETTVAQYVEDLKKQIADTKEFANTIQLLRKMGLNDEMYQDLLATGPSALPFIKELLAGGQSAVNEVNTLGKQLDSVATSLGKSAALSMYQAGVDMAAGIVRGLAKEQVTLEKQMDKLADAMVKAIKKKLGIKSPSRVFAEVGEWSAEGLVTGLKDSSDLIEKTAAQAGELAVNSLRRSMSDASKMMISDIDMTPQIRPVLDLTDVQKKAGKLSTLLPSHSKMSLGSIYTRAADTADSVNNSRYTGDDDPKAGPRPSISFTQNNYSPKAISTAENYRQTKNLLSTVKGGLDT